MQSHRRRAIFALVLVLNASVHLHDLRGFVQPGSLRTTHADSRCSDVACGASFGRAAVAAALNAGMALVENFNKLFEFSTGVQKMREALPTQSIEVKDEKSSEDVLSHHAQQLCMKIVVRSEKRRKFGDLWVERAPATSKGCRWGSIRASDDSSSCCESIRLHGCSCRAWGGQIHCISTRFACWQSVQKLHSFAWRFLRRWTHQIFSCHHFNLARRVARLFFAFLEKAGVSMNMVLDNCMEGDALSEEMKADWIALLKAAYQSGHHLVAVVQSETMAQSIANLNGARSRVAPEQLATTKYRWTKEQAQKYLALMLEERDIQPESINQEQFLINASIRDAHGGWLPVQMRNYLDNADEPRPPGAFTVKLCVMCQ